MFLFRYEDTTSFFNSISISITTSKTIDTVMKTRAIIKINDEIKIIVYVVQIGSSSKSGLNFFFIIQNFYSKMFQVQYLFNIQIDNSIKT